MDTEIGHFIRNLSYMLRDHPDRIKEFRDDLHRDLTVMFAYVEELESPIDRPELNDELEAQDDASFNYMVSKYHGVVTDIDIGNLRREASAIRQHGRSAELLRELRNTKEEDVAWSTPDKSNPRQRQVA